MAVSLSAPILVVNDYNTMVRILRNLLRQFGFSHIEEASDGRTALNKLRANDYQLVISDWNMAPMSGADFLKNVRSIDRFRQTPFVMVANEPAQAEAATRAGAGAYLVKPITAPTLKQKLISVLGAF